MKALKIFFGLEHGGLNSFDNITGHFLSYQHEPDNPHSLSGNEVSAIHVDQRGFIWVGTWHNGLNRFDQLIVSIKNYLEKVETQDNAETAQMPVKQIMDSDALKSLYQELAVCLENNDMNAIELMN